VSALRWALGHPLNRRQPIVTLFRWTYQNARRRLQPDRIVRLQFNGGLIEGPIGHDVINLITYVHGGYYDYDAMRALEVLLSPGQTFIDVGANIGSYSLLAASLIGSGGRIIAIEPSDSQLLFLRRNLARLPVPSTICTTPVADAERRLSFADEGHTTQHLVEPSGSNPALLTSTLDAELARIGGDMAGSFAKIDVEGWDAAVIVGAQQWLSSGPQGLLIEANDLNERSPVSWIQAFDLLRGYGFEFMWPEFATGRLHTFEHPGPVSPFGNYLILRPEEARSLKAALGGVHR
jgi:FkbM family methyltransferase